jgi:TatD DNase family protein
MLIDTHAHLNLDEFSGDYKDVIARSFENGISMINVGVNYESSLRAVGIANEYNSGVWAAVGLHPENINDILRPAKKDVRKPEEIKEPGFDAALYSGLAQASDKVVAIGETGLDYLHLPKDEARAASIREKQADVFKQHLALASELGLPVIIHTRMAHGDTIGILRAVAGSGGNINGVIHCFTGNAEEMSQYRELGLHFGINGIIFKLSLDEAIARMPLDRILLETDCPFLSPVPETKRNEPRFVVNIAKRLAQTRNEPVETILDAATANSKKLFNI